MITTTRDQEIQDIHIRYADFYRIGGGLTLIIIGVLIGAWIFGQNQFSLAENMLGYVTNVSTELLSVIATIAVIDQLNNRREREEYKLSLIRQAGSIANDIAIDAIEQLRKAEWLTGKNGVLKGRSLEGANLEKARLKEANLQDTFLRYANLKGAEMWRVNLQEADMVEVNLQDAYAVEANLQAPNLFRANLQNATLTSANLYAAHLEEADLRDADLRQADLESTNLEYAYLQAANLQQANLVDTNFENAEFDTKTVLPDAELMRDDDGKHLRDESGSLIYDKYWTPETDMTRYTDPNHPNFWQPDWIKTEREQGE